MLSNNFPSWKLMEVWFFCVFGVRTEQESNISAKCSPHHHIPFWIPGTYSFNPFPPHWAAFNEIIIFCFFWFGNRHYTFLSPGVGISKGPLRVPNLRSFSFISLQGTFFFISKSPNWGGIFWTPKFFNVTEGWMGWVAWDGREFFFLKLISSKLPIVFSNLSRIL